MTSISAASSLASLFLKPSPFTQMDADQNGKVTKDEFVAKRPKDVSETQASDLYAKLDTDGTNALTEDQLKAGMEANKPAKSLGSNANGGLSDGVLSALLNLVQQIANGSGTDETDKSKNADGKPSSADMFAKMDVNGDGTVTKDEFTAARPSDVSADKATAFYNSIDSQGTGSITEAQFAEARPAHGHHHGPPPSDPATTASTAQTATAAAGTTTTTASTDPTDALTKLMQAIKAYAAYSKVDVNKLADTLTAAA